MFTFGIHEFNINGQGAMLSGPLVATAWRVLTIDEARWLRMHPTRISDS
jgi:hypothetical protein